MTNHPENFAKILEEQITKQCGSNPEAHHLQTEAMVT